MKKKLVPLIAIAFVIAALSTAVFYSLFAIRLSGAAPPTSAQAKVVVAARDLAPGTVLAEADMSTMSWPAEQIPKGAYQTSGRIAGKTVFQAIGVGEPVLESRLAARDGTGLGIPEGMRAVSVHVSDSSGVVGLLKPGYKVDVQVFGWRSRKAASLEELRTMLRGASVLAVSTQSEPSSQGYFGAPVVTLLARVPDAEQLALADSYARLRLTLRNPLEPTGDAGSSVAKKALATPYTEMSQQGPARRLRLQPVALTDSGFAALAKRWDIRGPLEQIKVSASKTAPDGEALTGLLQPGSWSRAQAESVLAARTSQTSWYDLSRATSGIRVGFTPLHGSTDVRVRSEVSGSWNGREERHAVETKISAAPGQVIVITGLESGDRSTKDERFPHLVLLVTPENKAETRSAR